MIIGVCPTKKAVVIAPTTGAGETFQLKKIKAVEFDAGSGDELIKLWRRLVDIFSRGGKKRRLTIALLASSSGRFKSSVEAIKAEAMIELAAAEAGAVVVKVTPASLKKVLGCGQGQKWRARAAEKFNPEGGVANWSQGAAGAAAAALKVAGGG